jgi:hypothetical protein
VWGKALVGHRKKPSETRTKLFGDSAVWDVTLGNSFGVHLTHSSLKAACFMVCPPLTK